MNKGFRAILNINGKQTVFAKSSNTVAGLLAMLKQEGLNISHVSKIEEFNNLKPVQRGRAAAKH